MLFSLYHLIVERLWSVAGASARPTDAKDVLHTVR